MYSAMKLGCIAGRPAGAKLVRLEDHVDLGALPPMPGVWSCMSGATPGLLGNGDYGDCVAAEVGRKGRERLGDGADGSA